MSLEHTFVFPANFRLSTESRSFFVAFLLLEGTVSEVQTRNSSGDDEPTDDVLSSLDLLQANGSMRKVMDMRIMAC